MACYRYYNIVFGREGAANIKSQEFLHLIVGWETLANSRALNKLVFTYKVLGDHTAPNLKDLLELLHHSFLSSNSLLALMEGG